MSLFQRLIEEDILKRSRYKDEKIKENYIWIEYLESRWEKFQIRIEVEKKEEEGKVETLEDDQLHLMKELRREEFK